MSFTAELEALLERATPGPYHCEYSQTSEPIVTGTGLFGRICIARHSRSHADAELHAMLRTKAPEILELVRAAQYYSQHYLLDEYHEPRLCVDGEHEHLSRLFEALAKLDSK